MRSAFLANQLRSSRMSFTPTDEQSAIVAAARGSKTNLIVHALAGAAKTSTLVLIARACVVPTLSVAFNVRIAKEMTDRMPGSVTSRTLNGVGHRAWGNTRGGRCVVNKDKVYDICKALIDDLSGAEKSAGYELFTQLMANVRFGKTAGYVPKKFAGMAKPLMTEDELFAALDEEPSPLMEDLIIAASERSMTAAFDRQIDFDDQILLPTVFPSTFESFPLTLVDEAQDLSALNHAMLRKMVKTNRLIAVGDEYQSIYGFRGAHENSMELLRSTFEMSRHDLTICFRCPTSVVREARFRAPMMQTPESAAEGSVRHLATWTIEELPADATILCRNNAPLFRAAITLLKNGRYPELVGSDIGKAIIKILRKLGEDSTPVGEALSRVTAWKEEKLQKSRNPGAIVDQAECMEVFLDQATSLGGAIAYAERLLVTAGGIKLMTIHKAKGLEWDNVYLLDRPLINIQRTQERNLLYVAMTRAKANLTYITTEGFRGL